MAKGFKNLLIAMTVVGLFVYALINFGILFSEQNGVDSSLRNDSRVNSTFSRVGAELETAGQQANNSKSTIEESDQEETTEGIIVSSVSAVRTVFADIFFGVFNVIGGFIVNVLFGGSYSIVFGVVATIMLILIITYGIKWLRTGDPD